ncbi:MAG: transglutaminase-like domain-containing protein [Candidatus Thermoplasmatota archaeon]|nr:transglutaminase-like domain-containing protein [Candidatus Thermoplasmatota archaeon]
MIPPEIKENYTEDTEKYHITHPYITTLVQNITKKYNNPLVKVVKIHDYLINHLEYRLEGGWDDAITTLQRGTGSCSEYCFAFIALCRAAGIPARFTGGSIIKGDTPYIDTIFHRIVEIYLPTYSWIPIDPTWDDAITLRHFHIGAHLNTYFTIMTGGGPSDYLGWNYTTAYTSVPPSSNITITKSMTWLQWKPILPTRMNTII